MAMVTREEGIREEHQREVRSQSLSGGGQPVGEPGARDRTCIWQQCAAGAVIFLTIYTATL